MSTTQAVRGELASDGGEPVRRRPFAPWPQFSEEEIAAAAAVLRSGKVNYWTGGEGRAFESEFAAAVACRHAVAVTNGTVALELALAALGIGPGDEVIVPARTFIASASCVVLRGARPVIADVDRATGTLTAATVAPRITPRTRAVIAVHLAGWPCDTDALGALARSRGIGLIEDCAQAHGAAWRGRPAGSLGDIAAFSFCQDKILSTGGEGGMVTTNDAPLWERVWSLKDHGKSYAAVYRRAHPPGFRWLHESFGSNGRMTEMQAAIGRVLLRKLPEAVRTRRRHAAILHEELSAIAALRVPCPPPDAFHSYYKFYAYVRPERLRPDWNRDRVMAAMAAEGVPCLSGSCSEIYLEKAFPPELRPPRRLPAARELGETSLMFLVHPTLADDDIRDVCRAARKVFGAAAR
jgi:dTDP-4-amino-4,6-dideoxygalactose transaminase